MEHTRLRFINESQYTELVNLYHIGTTATAGAPGNKYHKAMIWACEEFTKKHPEISRTATYKDLSARMSPYQWM